MPGETRYGQVFGITKVALRDVLLEAIQAMYPPVRPACAFFDTLVNCNQIVPLRTELRPCSMAYLGRVGARMAFRLLYGGPVATTNATDFHHRLLAPLAARGKRIAVIGGRQHASERLTRELLALGFNEDRVLVQIGCNQIGDSQLLQAIQLFFPLPFSWARVHQNNSNRCNSIDSHFTPLIVATRDFLDFLAGRTTRAPWWRRAAGIEWPTVCFKNRSVSGNSI